MDCGEIPIRYYFKNKLQQEKTEACIVGEPYNGAMSISCLNMTCQARKLAPVQIPKHVHFSEVGNPLFRVCQGAGGNPQIAEYHHQNKWHKFSRCMFQDGFVPLGMIPYKIVP